MYVVATCGVFVVGVKCDMCTTNCNAVDTLNSIKKEFIPHCQDIFGLRVDEVKDVKVESRLKTALLLRTLMCTRMKCCARLRKCMRHYLVKNRPPKKGGFSFVY